MGLRGVWHDSNQLGRDGWKKKTVNRVSEYESLNPDQLEIILTGKRPGGSKLSVLCGHWDSISLSFWIIDIPGWRRPRAGVESDRTRKSLETMSKSFRLLRTCSHIVPVKISVHCITIIMFSGYTVLSIAASKVKRVSIVWQSLDGSSQQKRNLRNTYLHRQTPLYNTIIQGGRKFVRIYCKVFIKMYLSV